MRYPPIVVPLGIIGRLGLTVLQGSAGPGLSQVRDPRPVQEAPIQTIASAEALRARTPEDVALATFFASEGPDLLAVGNVVVVDEGGPEIPPLPPGEAPPTPIDPWTYDVCAAEVVLIGHATSERVLLNKSGTLLITISDLRVDRWLTPETGAKSLTLATQGGRVTLGDRLISFEIGSRRNFRKPWLLFLKRIPETTAFRLSGAPIPAGETMPQENRRADESTAGRWKPLRDRVTRVAATCSDKR